MRSEETQHGTEWERQTSVMLGEEFTEGEERTREQGMKEVLA